MNNWLTRLISGREDGVVLDGAAREALVRWRALPVPDLDLAHHESRYVVVNTEASGLKLDHDRLLAVAAIAVEGGLIDPAASYHAPVEPDPAAALANLLAFIGKAPVVVFNAGFNRGMLERAFDTHLGTQPALEWLDLFVLLPAFYGERIDGPARLGAWMQAFGIETFQRHHALGDAWAISQLLLGVLARARAEGVLTPRALAEAEHARRQLRGPV